MKTKLLLLLLWSSLGVFAQTKPDSSATYKEKADYVLAPLMRSGVPSGILLDRVFPASGIAKWQLDSVIHDTANGSKMIQAIYELEEAQIVEDPGQYHKKLIGSLEARVRSGFLPTGLVQMDVQMVDTNRFRDSTLVVDNYGQLGMKPGSSGSPFKTSRLKMASILDLGPLQAGKTYQLEYPDFFTNVMRGTEVGFVRFRLGSEAWQTLQPGQTIPVTFPTSGRYDYYFEVKWQDNTTLLNPGQLFVTSNCSLANEIENDDDCPLWAESYPASCGNSSEKIEALIPFLNIAGKGEVYHFRRNAVNNDCNFETNPLRNPVIFVDGIDFTDQRKGQAIYGKYLRYENNTSGTTRFLGKELRSTNHDLLILNFPDGTIQTKYTKIVTSAGQVTWIPVQLPNPDVVAGKANANIDGGCDYIERNAMILVELIRRTQSRMSNPQDKIVLIGPSMGGLIARYALAYMEKHQNDPNVGPHNCKLYVSQDAPHLGSNVPIGVQALIQNLADGFGIAKAQEFLDRKINVPATKELLLNHISATNYGQDQLRIQFIQNQNDNGPIGKLGWPVHADLKKVAIINGSLKGKASIADVPPISRVVAGDRIFDMDVHVGGIIPTLIIALTNSITNLAIKNMRARWEINYAPGGGTSGTVLKQKYYFNTFLGDINGPSNSESVGSFNQGVSIDAAPGGLYDAPDQVYQKANEPLNGILCHLLNVDIGTHKKYACFIPSKSALAYHWNTDKLATDLGENLSNRNLVCTGEIPFNDYFQVPSAFDENDQHIKLNQLSAAFITSKLNPVPPPQINYAANLVGPKGVQAGSKTDFTVEYQGDFDFITNWQIVGFSGISATLTNPNSATCQVQVGNSNTGSQDGYFILKAVTMVRTITGEIICAGESQRKVFVRKLPNIGNIDQLCNLVSKNYSINFKSVKPSASMQPNGVIFNRAEWQISEYSNTDFGPDAWQYGSNWSFHVSPNSEYNMGPPSNITYLRSMVFFQGGLSPSAGGTFYIRARGIFTMINPDNNQETIEITSAWKNKAADFTITSTPTLCPSHIVVTPDPVIKGTDHNISFVTPRSISLPATGEILDQRGNSVIRFEISNPLQTVPVEKLDLAEYTLKVSSGTTDRMVISPNPLIKGIDETALVRIFGSATTDDRFNVTLTNPQGETVQDVWVEGREFTLDVTDLAIGSYVVTVKGENTLFEEVLEMRMKGQPYIQVNPNPVMDLMNAEIVNPIDPDDSYTITISDKLGLNVLETTHTGSTFQLDLSGLPPDLYYVKMTGKGITLSKLFRKE
jgi:hypothetical protein